LEKEWYGICNRSAFIPQHVLDYYIPALKARGKHVAIAVGLSDFHAHTCPKCGEQGQFKIHFLGRLEHPECHWTGYMDTGSYIGFQITQILHSGMRAGAGMKEDSDRKGDRSGGWIGGILVFVFVGICRALLAVVLIPLHNLVALFQPGQTGAAVATRIITLCLILAGLTFGIYEIQHASRLQFQQQAQQQVQPSPPGFTQFNQPKRKKLPKHKLGPYHVVLSADPGAASNWTTVSRQGATQLNWLNPAPMEIIAQPTNPPSGMTLYGNQILNGDVAATFTFNHQGFGRTMVGLWSVATNTWAVAATLDTNDTNYLDLSSAVASTEYKYSGSPYMNRWITIQIQTVQSRAYFRVDGVVLENMPLSAQGGYRPAVSVGSVSWKSGANDTYFRSITANGN